MYKKNAKILLGSRVQEESIIFIMAYVTYRPFYWSKFPHPYL